jgi:dienelactone hydrolase
MPSRLFTVAALFALPLLACAAESLPDTKPLTEQGDLAAKMVEGIDKYLMREIAASAEKRKQYWKPDFSSPEAYLKSVQPNRERLKKILGVVDERVPFTDLEYVSGPKTPALVAETDAYQIFAVRWPVLPGVEAEGLLLEPKGKVDLCVVAIPDADWTPEMIAGLEAGPKASQFPGIDPTVWGALKEKFWVQSQYARRLAENGCRVLIPTLIDRKDDWSGNPTLGRMTNQPHREFLYRMSYELGRHVIGYEIQKVLAAVDWFCREKDHPPVAVYGYGEGGLLAFYSGAIDERIRSTVVVGYFGPREEVWKEPIYRNVWGLLNEFGDAELAANLFCPAPPAPSPGPMRIHRLFIENSLAPVVDGPPAPGGGRSGAAPGRLWQRPILEVEAEFQRSLKLVEGKKSIEPPFYAAIGGPQFPGMITYEDTLKQLVNLKPVGKAPTDARKGFDPKEREHRQFDQLVQFTQKLLRDSERRRQETFWSKLDTSSLEKYEASCKPFRAQLDEEVIGLLPKPTEAMNPRWRLLYDEPKYRAYEVTLDIYPDVYAYGILALPKDLKPGEKRPVVVCQHGLEGRPTDVICPNKDSQYYHSFGSRLAEMGYIVYAPQNPYIGRDNFRVLQRKANPLGLSLFSFIVRQHRTTLDWLSTLPNVDPKRIAFYGLSYGGKTAMRVPALETRYCLSICSGDFNEWVAKNASVDFAGSYMFTNEYEMPEWNLGHTFNYAEMAALIAPRPFMVERGHNDSVGIDEMVAHEYAKVRRLYSRLKIPERTEIEYFEGPHEIHGVGTFAFLKKQLKWPPE